MSFRRRHAPFLLLLLAPLAACGTGPATAPCFADQEQPPYTIVGPDDAQPTSCPTHHLIKE